jgi:hypothetical protein
VNEILDPIKEFFLRLWAVLKLPIDYFQLNRPLAGIVALLLVVGMILLIVWGWRVRHGRGRLRA